MRIECEDCQTMLDVELPIAKFAYVRQYSDEELAEIRATSDRVVGHAVTEAVVQHSLYNCPAKPRPHIDVTLEELIGPDCGHASPMGYRCDNEAGHAGEHQAHIDEPGVNGGEPIERTIASWPNLQAVP